MDAFFKIFSDLEEQTELMQDDYTSLVPAYLRWEAWAHPGRQGRLNRDALPELVNGDLLPALKELDLSALTGLPRARAAL